MRYRDELIAAMRRASRSPKLFHAFLTDLLTPQEYEEIIKRWQIVRMLERHIPQRTIARSLHVSIAKVTRGSRVMRQKSGGFKSVLSLLN